MDDWNDFGPDSRNSAAGRNTVQSSWHHDSDEPASTVSFPSWRSASAAEPRSVMMRQLPSHSPPEQSNVNNNNNKDDNSAPPNNPPQPTDRSSTDAVILGPAGDLDAATDCEELGVTRSGRNYGSFTKSSDRYHSVSYTKLEVISAQQIQQLLHAFHILIATALCWSIFSAILIDRTSIPYIIGLRATLLSRSQKDRIVNDFLTQKLTRIDTSHSERISQYSTTTDSLTPLAYGWIPLAAVKNQFERQCRLRQVGLCPVLDNFVKCEIPNLDDINNPCYPYWSSTSSLEVVSRQEGMNLSNVTGETNDVGVPILVGPKNAILAPYRTNVAVAPKWYMLLGYALVSFMGVFLMLLAVLFLIRLVRCGRRNISQEQIFTCGFIFVSLLYFNVIYSINTLVWVFNNRKQTGNPTLITMLSEPMLVLKNIALSPMLLFFIWANIHAYRILDPLKKLGPQFFLPKILALAPYAFIKVFVFLKWKITTSESLFISAVMMQHHFGRFNMLRAYPVQFGVVIALTLYELFLFAIIVWQTALTMKALRRAPYMRHRSKHTGFRFFIYINFVFFMAYSFTQVLVILAAPYGTPLVDLTLTGWFHLRMPEQRSVASIFLLSGYIIIWAHVNLPHDSIGAVKGWVSGSELAPSSMRWSSASSSDASGLESDTGSGSGSISGIHSVSGYSRAEQRTLLDCSKPRFIVDKDYELNQEIIEPVTYRKRESDNSLDLKANCFTMQTHVFMFNFAWYVYYYDTPKFERLKEKDQVLPFSFKVAESIREESTDTQCLIIDGADRIIVSFKGSTSLRNLRTSLAVYHERLKNVVPTNIDGADEHERLNKLFQRSYDGAKIHKGFAVAYASVAHRVMSGIKRLHDENPRPIFLTGHSLGGALATICSLDVWVKLRISRRSIFVSTFGSPRVGNEAFKRVYNSVIVLHWRIVVDPDMVAKLPKGMFRHVGKKVTLTQHGDLFIDPNALELKLWSGSTAGFAYHRKASYLLAMQAWCLRHHKLTYTPEFWEFPVRDEDRERFVGARFEEANEDLEAPHMKAVKKIILLDAMVDSLNNESNSTPVGNAAAVEKWARLTRRLLLRHKLTSAVNKSGGIGVP